MRRPSGCGSPVAYLHQFRPHLHPTGAIGVLDPSNGAREEVVHAQFVRHLGRRGHATAVLLGTGPGDYLESLDTGKFGAYRLGKTVGEVTSGTFSPTLQKSIAMGYVDANHAGDGIQLVADLKGTPNPAKVVKLPFYKRPS